MSEAPTELPVEPPVVAATRCLYIVVPLDTPRFKVGTAFHPKRRWRTLGLRQLDMHRTTVLEGPAWAIDRMETWLHFELNRWHRPLEEVGNGYSEWFDISGLEAAMAALERLEVTHQHLNFRHVSLAELQPPRSQMPEDGAALSGIAKERRKAEALEKSRKTLEDDIDATWITLDRWEQLARYALYRADGVDVNESGDLVIAFNGLSDEETRELDERIWRSCRSYEIGEFGAFNFHLGSRMEGESARLTLQARRPEDFIERLSQLAELRSLPSAQEAAGALNAFYDRLHRAVATMPPAEHVAPTRSISQMLWEEELRQAG